jgi:predicted MFS family arabinose efflux permease
MAAFSVSTVAGVPLSLFLANHISFLGWRAPFMFIGLISVLILFIGYRNIPKISSRSTTSWWLIAIYVHSYLLA